MSTLKGFITHTAETGLDVSRRLLKYTHERDKKKFNKRAIKYLVKKLKDKLNELDYLVTAVTTYGANPSKCVTLIRTADGRLQGVERPTARTECSTSPTMFINLSTLRPASRTKTYTIRVSSHYFISQNLMLHALRVLGVNHILEVNLTDSFVEISGCVTYPHLIYVRMWRWPDLKNHWRELRKITSCKFAFDLNCTEVCVNPYHYERIVTPLYEFPRLTMAAEYESANTVINQAEFVEPTDQNSANQNCAEPPTEESASQGPSSELLYSDTVHRFNSTSNWCTIAYFEYDLQIGPIFQIPLIYARVNVTGYVDQVDGFNICLGHLANPSRHISTERCRLTIGKGVQLEWRRGSEIWMRVLSKKQIFLQSAYMDVQTGYRPRQVTYKIYPSSVLKIFDLKPYYLQPKATYDMVEKLYKNQKNERVPLLTQFTTTEALSVGLQRFCTIRISFNKGWGPGYPKTRVEETCCWVEIFLNEAYQLLRRNLLRHI